MAEDFVISEVYKGNTYNKYTPHRIVQCLSISEEGFTAITEKNTCLVLNPFTSKTYFVPSENTFKISENQEIPSKKAKQSSFDEDEGQKEQSEYCLAQWTPPSLSFNGSSFLLTIKYNPEIKLWGLPYTFDSATMVELANLTPFITATSLYTENCTSIGCIHCCFSEDGRFLVISINDVFFIFTIRWDVTQKPCLLVQLNSCFRCEAFITSCCISNQCIVYGTSSGELRRLSLPSDISSSPSADDFVATAPQQKDEELYSVICSDHWKIHQGKELLLCASLLKTSHPFQSSITHIYPAGAFYLVSDGVHIVLVRTNGDHIFSVEVPEGIHALSYEDGILRYITTNYSVVSLDPETHAVVASMSLLPTLQSYCDFAMIGATTVKSSFLILSYCLSNIRTTTVDYRYQLLMLHSVGFLPSSPAWLPMVAFIPPPWKNMSPDCGQYTREELHQLHIHLCRLLRSSGRLKDKDSVCDMLVAIQRHFLKEAHQALRSPQSQWLLHKLGMMDLSDIPSCDCECCKRKVVMHQNHAEWCSLGHIDQYCWSSLQPILTSHVLLCPCCLHAYLEGTSCIFRNLHLIKTNYLSQEQKIGRERIFWSRNNPVGEWNCI